MTWALARIVDTHLAPGRSRRPRHAQPAQCLVIFSTGVDPACHDE